jgi:hypothetical protein
MEVKDGKLEKVLVTDEPSQIEKIARYDGMRPNETHVSTVQVPHSRYGSVYVHHFSSDDGTNARHLVSMFHDPTRHGVSILLAARENEDEPMRVYAAATHPNFRGNRLNYLALKEAVKSHGKLYSDVMQTKGAFKNWTNLQKEPGFKVNMTKPFREGSTEDASLQSHIAQYSKAKSMEKAVTPEQQKENIKKQRQLKNKEIIAKLKSKIVDKESAAPTVKPHLLMPKDDSPVGIPVYLKTHKDHDSLAGVHVHVSKLPELKNYGLLDHPEIDKALDRAEERGHKAVYVSTDSKPTIELRPQPDQDFDVDPEILESMKERLKPQKPKSHLKLIKALWFSEKIKKSKKTAHTDDAETGIFWEKYLSEINFSSEKEALDFIKNKTERDNENYKGVFKPTDFHKDIEPHIKAVKAGKSFKIKSAYGTLKKPFNSFNYESYEPDSESSIPKVTFTEQDTDGVRHPHEAKEWYGPFKTNARAYYAYVPEEHIPESKMPDNKKGYESNYDWDSFNFRSKKGFPPVKLKIHSSGKVSILDGNHRIHHWRSQGHTHIPAIIIDERDSSKIDSENFNKSEKINKKLIKALWSAPKVVGGQYAKPFSMGGTKKEKKTIYSHFSHPEHAKFNAQEHLDAYWRHQDKIKQNPKMEPSLANFHKQQAQQHWDKSRELVDKHDTSRRIEENKPG